jgi:hypothetical protein
VKHVNLIRKEKKTFSKVLKIYAKNESSIHEIMENEKEIHASLVVTPQNEKVVATVHKCLVKMKRHYKCRWNV